MQNRFEKVTLARIFWIKKLQQLKYISQLNYIDKTTHVQDKLLVDILFGNRRVEIGRFNKLNEKLVHKLNQINYNIRYL